MSCTSIRCRTVWLSFVITFVVAACALAREETRGAHARIEFPEPDPALDGRHTVVESLSSAPRLVSWDGRESASDSP